MSAVKVIGITGNTSSGKTTLCEHLSKKGYKTVDVDKLAHSLYSCGKPLYRKLIREYGKSITKKSGAIDRNVLREIVFKNRTSYRKFNSIIFPVLNKALKSSISNLKSGIVLLDMAVLFESGFHKYCDEIIFVIMESKKKKMTTKTLKNKEKYSKIEEFQKTYPVSKKIALSSYILYNNKTKRDMYSRAEIILNRIGAEEYGRKAVRRKNKEDS